MSSSSPITWEKKTELCRLANTTSDITTCLEFLKFTCENMAEFDEQAWEMFFAGVPLTPEYFCEQTSFHLNKIYDSTRSFQSDSLRTCMRASLFDEMVVEMKERIEKEKKERNEAAIQFTIDNNSFIIMEYMGLDPNLSVSGVPQYKEAKYHQSWDWIMPVWIKITNTILPSKVEFARLDIGREFLLLHAFIDNNGKWKDKSIYHSCSKEAGDCLTLHEVYYKSVVDFINLLNSCNNGKTKKSKGNKGRGS